MVPIKRLSPEQVKQVKTQILMAKAEAAAASTAAMTAGRAAAEPGNHAAHDGEEPSESDEPGHRGAPSHPGASSPVSNAEAPDDDDPWAHPMPAQRVESPASQRANAEQRPTAGAPMASPAFGAEDDDPWMTPITPVPPMPSQHKHVAVPDLSDDDDPWAHPLPAPQAPEAVPDGGVPQASQASQPPMAPQPSSGHERHFLATAVPGSAAADPWSSVPSAGGFEARVTETAGPDEPSGPQVDPDEDEYSLSDESLGTATALSVEELSKIFEVKKVEEFAADDPKNPRNAQPSKHGSN